MVTNLHPQASGREFESTLGSLVTCLCWLAAGRKFLAASVWGAKPQGLSSALNASACAVIKVVRRKKSFVFKVNVVPLAFG